VKRSRAETVSTPSAVPDVLGPGLEVVFCGINPGRVSAASNAHFANPRNDFWRLLHDAGFTPRLYEPHEQFALLELGLGVTNAAYRTTKGSGDLRRRDFDGSARRLEQLARNLSPRALAFVGKEAFRGAFGTRPDLGPQVKTLGDVGLFVLPSTSPANAAVPYSERLRWFQALHEWIEPIERHAVRGVVVDRRDRVLLVLFRDSGGQTWWATTGGGADAGERPEDTVRRELAEEVGLVDFELGPEIWTREHTFAWDGSIYRQRERYYLVRVDDHEPAPTIDLAAEHVHDVRWWTLDELDAVAPELLAPRTLARRLRDVIQRGPPPAPIDVGV
jgi:TDG/mug DNA glycosylase family protein